MKRITVVGTPGAGKTTLAQQLAARLQYPFIELDALFWGPGWTPCPRDIFRQRVAAAIQPDCWTTGGNYSLARDLLWKQSDTLVWLDYPLPFTFWRLLRRTLSRVVTQEELWAGNRESWKEQFFSRDSLLLFALKTHHRRCTEFSADIALPEYAHLQVIRFSSPRRARQWMEGVTSSVA